MAYTVCHAHLESSEITPQICHLSNCGITSLNYKLVCLFPWQNISVTSLRQQYDVMVVTVGETGASCGPWGKLVQGQLLFITLY